MIRIILHFRFDIPYTDDPEDSKLEIIVQLSQKDARSTLLSDQRQNLVIGFSWYFHDICMCVTKHMFSDARHGQLRLYQCVSLQ